MRSVTYFGKTALSLAIRGYRRFLSGRGPLRRVCCTFATTESCSAYGLRAVDEVATSLPHALRLVRSRLHACRRSSIYRFHHGLGWERDHDAAPGELARVLAARGERPDTIAQVLAARTLVARWRGERDAYLEMKRLATKPQHPIAVRAGDAAITHHRRAVRRGVALIVVALVAAMVASAWFLLGTIAAVATIANARASAQRLEQQRVAAKFLRPAAT